MSQIDDLFDKARHLHVVEEQHAEAAKICRHILELEPNHNMARMLLGVILGDYGKDEVEILESKEQFIEVLKRIGNLFEMTEYAWSDENPIHQLGIWEWNRENILEALVLLLIDFCVSSHNRSLSTIKEILVELKIKDSELIEYLLKRIEDEKEKKNGGGKD